MNTDLITIANAIADANERRRVEREKKYENEKAERDVLKKKSVGQVAPKLDAWEMDFQEEFYDEDFKWYPVTVEEYTVPPFSIPKTRKQADQRAYFSKVLAFIDLVKQKRVVDGCTIMPIPTTNKQMISICGSSMNVSRLIAFMKDIGLISIENDYYQYNANNPNFNQSRTYRYYYLNEVLIKKYCEDNKINTFEISNVDDKLLEIINNEVSNKRINQVSVVNIFDNQITSFEPSEVKFSSHLHLLKPDNFSKKQFENRLTIQLWLNYPQLLHYQLLANRINNEFYIGMPDYKIWFKPNFKWNRGNKSIRKIGIRATNNNTNMRASREKVSRKYAGKFKDDFLKEEGLNLEKDVKSSVPRITISLNNLYWISEDIDLYEVVDKLFNEITGNKVSVVNTFADRRSSIKSLFMRGYFDSEEKIGVHTRNAMEKYIKNSTEEERAVIDKTMISFKEAIVIALGGVLFDSEIFLHESCIYMDVLKQLLDDGFVVWECYDAWYAKKSGWTQEQFEQYVTQLVEDCANEYIKKYIAG